MTKQSNPGMSCVSCSVRDCKFHDTENFCTASNIKVQNENAQRKAETYCGTFIPRSSI